MHDKSNGIVAANDEFESDKGELEGMLSYFMDMQQKLLKSLGDPSDMNDEKLKEISGMMQGSEFNKVFQRLQDMRKKYVPGDEDPMAPLSGLLGSGSNTGRANSEEVENQLRAVRGKIKQIISSVESLHSGMADIVQRLNRLESRIKALESKLK